MTPTSDLQGEHRDFSDSSAPREVLTSFPFDFASLERTKIIDVRLAKISQSII